MGYCPYCGEAMREVNLKTKDGAAVDNFGYTCQNGHRWAFITALWRVEDYSPETWEEKKNDGLQLDGHGYPEVEERVRR